MEPAKFKTVEQKYRELSENLKTGLISPDEMKKALKQMMIQDDQGQYWMIGGKTGKWYMYNGTEWKEGTPYQEEEVYQQDFEELLGSEYQTEQPEPQQQSNEETVQVESLDNYSVEHSDEYQTVEMSAHVKQDPLQDNQVNKAQDYESSSILDDNPQVLQNYSIEDKQEYQAEENQTYGTNDEDTYRLEENQDIKIESGGDFQVEYNSIDSHKEAKLSNGEAFQSSILDDDLGTHDESGITQLYNQEDNETIRLDSPLEELAPVVNRDETQIEEPLSEIQSSSILLDEPITNIVKKQEEKKGKKEKKPKTKKIETTTKKIAKAESKNDELVITSINMVSLVFFLGGIGMIIGVLFGATFGIFTAIFGELISFFPEILQGTQGGLAGGLIFAAIGGIGGFVLFAIAAMIISSIYNLIAFIFGGIRFKVK